MLQPKKLCQQEQGFTIVEVLVSMLIICMFIAVALQAVVIAAIFQARAEQYDEAITWIQQDLEFVIHQAGEYEKNANPYSARCNAVTANNGFAAGLLNNPIRGIGGSPKVDGPRSFGGGSFILTRTANYATSPYPFKLLQLNYTVAPENGGSPIATLDTEVIPNAVFKCP